MQGRNLYFTPDEVLLIVYVVIMIFPCKFQPLAVKPEEVIGLLFIVGLCCMEVWKEMFYIPTHSTHFILRLYGVGHMVKDHSDNTRYRHLCYSFRLTARVLLYAPSHRQDRTYHGFCYKSRGALVGTRNSSMGPPHEGSIRRHIAPRANALTTELHLAPGGFEVLLMLLLKVAVLKFLETDYMCLLLHLCVGFPTFHFHDFHK